MIENPKLSQDGSKVRAIACLEDLQSGILSPGWLCFVGVAADEKWKGPGRFKTGLEFSLGPIRALYRLFNNSFVKE